MKYMQLVNLQHRLCWQRQCKDAAVKHALFLNDFLEITSGTKRCHPQEFPTSSGNLDNATISHRRAQMQIFPLRANIEMRYVKTACSSVIPCVCLNVNNDNAAEARSRRIVKWLSLPVLDGSSGEVGQSSLVSPVPFDFCCRWRGGECSLTHPIQHTRAHLALREKALSLFNPHYSRGADSIWWVSEPCSVHLLHSPPPTYLPFISSLWLQLLFFSFFLRAQGNQMAGALFFFFFWSDVWMDEWTDGCGGCTAMDWQHDITALPGVKDLC